MEKTLQKFYGELQEKKEGDKVEHRGQRDTLPSSDSTQEMFVLLRLIEFRQKELEGKFKVFMEEQNGRGGDRERGIIVEQRINSAMCVGKWLAGIVSALVVIFAAWVTFQVWSVRDRELGRHGLPPVVIPQAVK